MKKSTMIAAVFAASAFSALAADVYSSNVVGYTKVTLAADNFNMLSAAFVPVGGGEGKKITEIFSDNSQFTSGYASTEADYINVWNGGGYNTYFYSAFIDAWASDQDSFTETEDALPCTEGFWLYRLNTALPVILAGQVVTTNVTVSAIAGNNFNMIGNPYAAPMPIKDILASTGSFTSGYASTEADYINVWNGAGYDTYFYSAFIDAWASDQDSFTETDAVIPVGASFWFYSLGTVTSVTLPLPYSVQ